VTGDGHGQFTSTTTPVLGAAVTTQFVGATAGFLDGDKKADPVIITTNSNGDPNLTVMLSSSGSPPEAATYTIGSSPGGVVLADLDGKNGLDIAVSDAAGSVYMLWNDGSGAFAVSSPIATGLGAHGIAAGDLDQDGQIDLVTADSTANTVTLLFNRNGFTNAGMPLGVGMNPVGVAVGDVTGDGVPDLVVTNQKDSTVSVYFNKADHTGGFLRGSDVAVYGAGRVALADLNGDGASEILVAGGGPLELIPALGGHKLGPVLHYDTNGAFAVTTGDLDGDGKLDVATGGFAGFVTLP